MRNLYDLFLMEFHLFLGEIMPTKSNPFKRLFTALQSGNGISYSRKKAFKKVSSLTAVSLFIIFSLFSTTKVSSQQLGNYPFTGLLLATCPNTNNGVSGQAANATLSNYTTAGTVCVASTTSFVTSQLNTTLSVNTAQYNQFSVTANAGYLLRLTSLSFSHQTSDNPSGGASSQWVLRSSIDNYTSNISSGATVKDAITTSTINFTGTNFTNIGTVTFRLYVTNIDKSSTTWMNDNVTANGLVVKIPNNPANPTSNSPQCVTPGVTLTRSGSPTETNVGWYWQSTATGNSTAKPEATCTVNTSGTYYIRALDTVYGIWSSGAGSLAVTITPNVSTPVFALGSTSQRCQKAENVPYTATASNASSITYSLDATSLAAGNKINAATGVVDYDGNWFGTSVITATVVGCGGPLSASHTVTIAGKITDPVYVTGSIIERCQGSETIIYSANSPNSTSMSYSIEASGISGGNSVDASTGAVTFAPGWTGSFKLKATATGCEGPRSKDLDIRTLPAVTTPVFKLGPSVIRCQAAQRTQYAATATNETSIVYSLDATSLAAGNIVNSGNGDVTFTANWIGISTVTATAYGNCNSGVFATETIETYGAVQTPVFNLGTSSTRCLGANTISYVATATYANGITYSLDANSTAAGCTINAATGSVTFPAGFNGPSTITATASGCSSSSSSTHIVTIMPPVGAPVFDIAATSVRCQGAGVVNYNATATNTTGITYSLDAASRTAGNSINAATGDVTYVAGWSGTSIITASAAGCNGPKTATHTVTITTTVVTPVFAMGATSTRCEAGSTVTYTSTATNNTGITYSLDAASTAAGNTIDAATGTVTWDAGWFGTSTITATATGCNGPSAANHTVTTNAPVTVPVFAKGANSVICQAPGAVTYTASASNTTGITYSLDGASITGGNSINATTGVVTFSAGWSGTSTITARAAGCSGPQTATHTVTITPTVGSPVFSAGATSARCVGAETILYSASATNNTGITYSLDAASAAGGNSINVTTGEVTFAANWIGSTTITATATGCNGPKTSTHTVTTNGPVAAPVFVSGATSTICQGTGTVTYTSSANYASGITYTLDAASLAAGNTIVATTGAVTYVASWTGSSVITATATGCNGPSTASHTVTITPTVGVPVFDIAATSVRCQGAGVVNYNATATNTTGITYTLDAASRTAGNSINAATGDVTYVAGWSGTSTITASAAGCNGPKTATHTVTITP
ncbi:beta strand repeat-containing protein, partial [Segetibacter aerophilus]|uniref:beta strand repeat-containing protein n=1 Tax=Segetibacter aerophilus TaxID=670293 RepID=UPI0011BEFFEF